ncbi:pyridoxamine 5'-phosphate oxidase family protein [Pseudooceanicola sediminis]|nr:pyridoxamine 5'-phosphate oxidase family protein [Pseudooceanicola sediminis]
MKDFADKMTEQFWTRMDKVRAGMLHTTDDRIVPMTAYPDPDEGALWFITAEGTDAHQAAKSNHTTTFIVSDASAKIYARVHGQLSAVTNPEKLDEIWSPIAGAWFKDGREDSSVRLLRLIPTKAEVWLTDGGAGFLYEIAKAKLSDATPDAGDHGVITF